MCWWDASVGGANGAVGWESGKRKARPRAGDVASTSHVMTDPHARRDRRTRALRIYKRHFLCGGARHAKEKRDTALSFPMRIQG